MRTVIQRVSSSSVAIDGVCHGEIGRGMNVLIGIEDGDTDEDIEWLCNKIVNLRIFDDDSGIMNLSVRDVDGDILVISQFTLYASTRKGNRPSYIKLRDRRFPFLYTRNFYKDWKIFWGSPLKKVYLVQI